MPLVRTLIPNPRFAVAPLEQIAPDFQLHSNDGTQLIAIHFDEHSPDGSLSRYVFPLNPEGTTAIIVALLQQASLSPDQLSAIRQAATKIAIVSPGDLARLNGGKERP